MNAFSNLLRCREALGLTVGLLALTCLPVWERLLTEPGWLFGLLVLLSCIAGFVTGTVAVSNGADPTSATRSGAWTAFFAALAGAAVFALIARMGLSWLAVTRAGIAGLLTLLPASFYGMICAGVAAVAMTPTTAPAKNEVAALSSKLVWGARAALAQLVLVAIILPPPSPLKIALPAVSDAMRPAPPPSRPSFSFTPPQGMEKADLLQWKLVKQREFTGVEDATVVLSRDDRYAAASLLNKQAIQVMDLHTADIWQVKVPGRVTAFSLHPDNRRIFVLFLANEELRCGVADIESGELVFLPKPRQGTIPRAPVLWWKDKQVLFAHRNERLMLNLDNLELEPAESVQEWKALDPVIQDKLVRELTAPTLDNLRWQWGSRPRVRETELPAVTGTSQWPVTLEPCLSLTHHSLDYSKVFPQVAIQGADRLLSSRDGSIVLRAANGVLTQHCFELDSPPKKTWKIKMPRSPAQGQDGPDTQRALESGELALLVYPPMINPLNQQIVGAVRSEVAAVLRFKSWIDQEAEVYLWQSYRPIQEQDIIADLCVMPASMNGSLFDSPESQRWWLKMSSANGVPLSTDAVPEQKARAEMLEKVEKRDRAAREEQMAKDVAEKQKKAEEAAAVAKAEMEKAAAKQAELMAAVERAAMEARKANVETKLKNQLDAFIRKHHQKSKEGDVEGLVSDYAARVDYFDKGTVDRSWILEDETKYHSTQVILDERIISDIVIRPDVKSGGYEAFYDLRLHAQNITNNRQSGGDFATRLIIGPTNEGFKIILHHSRKKP